MNTGKNLIVARISINLLQTLLSGSAIPVSFSSTAFLKNIHPFYSVRLIQVSNNRNHLKSQV